MRSVDLHKDYFTLVDWWTKHNWQCVPKNMLPQTGFIVENTAAGFLYQSDSKICWLEFLISNPEVSKEQRDKALNNIIAKLIDTAKELKFEAIFSSVVHPKLIQRYKNHGFTVTDENMTNLIRRL